MVIMVSKVKHAVKIAGKKTARRSIISGNNGGLEKHRKPDYKNTKKKELIYYIVTQLWTRKCQRIHQIAQNTNL